MTERHWIAADWGTSNLRVWAMSADGSVLAQRRSDRGMGTLSPGEFETAFLETAGDLLADAPSDVLICGMAGARGGWAEAGYVAVPCAPASGTAVRVTATDPRVRVSILPGLSQAYPADVMRGEETQVAGVLATFPDFDGAVCLPGTHSKWVRVAGGLVQHFQTFMTGELFALLSGTSILRHAIDSAWDDACFDRSVAEALEHPERTSAALFSVRSEGLLKPARPGAARARLSGILIGLELAGTRDYWQAERVVVVADAATKARYRRLESLATEVLWADTGTMTLEGLKRAYKSEEAP